MLTVFGPQRYVRTTGAKNEYTTVVKVPAWVRPPFTLHVQNGELNGTYRVSSASIGVNGTIVAGTADFNVTVPSLDRAVVLTPETSLKVTLASKPTSYLVIGLGGTSGDGTAPTLAITAPANGAFVDTTTPALAIEYRDLAGTGEVAASGVDVSTLEVWLDGARLSVERCLVLLRPVEIELATLQRTLVLRSEICFGFGQRLERSR